jgi:hypothetical protein
METRNQKLIRKILGEEGSQTEDHSLRSAALDRALSGKTPRTMTPWEWEEWYALHGRPDEESSKKGDD